MAEQRGITDKIHIDSAGTIGYHTGNPADARMRTAARRRGYDLTSRARQVHADDLTRFTLIIAMDQANLDDLQRLASDPGIARPTARLELLSHFLPAQQTSSTGQPFGTDVPDPYYGGEAGFEHVLDMIEAAMPAILDELTS